MKKYTLGTTPQDIIEQNLPHKYSMELNKQDMLNLLECLNTVWQTSDVVEQQDWAIGFRSSILQTIGIEEV